MTNLANDLVFWLITAVIGGLLVYLVKKYFDNLTATQSKHSDSIHQVASDIRVMVSELTTFRTHCTETEGWVSDRIDEGEKEIGELKTKTAEHEVKINEHERRIILVEKKIS